MKTIKTPHIIEQEAFKNALTKLEEVQTIINSDTDKTYSPEQIESIIQGTDAIKAAFHE